MKIIIFVLGWLSVGVYGSALGLGQLRGEFPSNYKDPKWAASRCKTVLVTAIGGPINLLAVTLVLGIEYPAILTCEPIK